MKIFVASEKAKAHLRADFVLSALLAILLFSSSCNSEPVEKNILLITVDTLRADRLGCYGSTTVKTPNIDSLAAAGVLFEDALSPVPITLPAHASILTGLYPAEHGIRDNGFYRLPREFATLTTVLSSHGYSTAAFVSSHSLNHVFGLDNGFDVYDDLSSSDSIPTSDDRSERPASEVTDVAIRWLKSSSEPFFAWVHYFDPHAPFRHPPEYLEEYRGRAYEGEIAYTDSEIGRLIRALKEEGVFDRTLIVFAADHGEGLGDHGERTHGIFLYGSTMRVPLIFSGHGAPRGERRPTSVSIIDITPTILGHLNIAEDFEVSGRNLWPHIVGGAALESRPLYMETESPKNLMGWMPLRGIRTGRYKFITGAEEELYDIKSDPGELKNVVSTEPEVARRIRLEMEMMEAGFHPDGTSPRNDYAPDANMRRNLKSLGYIDQKLTRRPSAKTPAQRRWLLSMFQMLEKFQMEKDCPKVIEHGMKAIELDPTNPRFMEIVAGCLHALNRLEEAAALYERLLEHEPRLLAPWADLAFVYSELGRYEEGRGAVKRALELDPNFPHAYSVLGLVEERDGNLELAGMNYRRALELDPNNKLALHKLGKAKQ